MYKLRYRIPNYIRIKLLRFNKRSHIYLHRFSRYSATRMMTSNNEKLIKFTNSSYHTWFDAVKSSKQNFFYSCLFVALLLTTVSLKGIGKVRDTGLNKYYEPTDIAYKTYTDTQIFIQLDAFYMHSTWKYKLYGDSINDVMECNIMCN